MIVEIVILQCWTRKAYLFALNSHSFFTAGSFQCVDVLMLQLQSLCIVHHYSSFNHLITFQITTPSFPVVVKIGHAHSGMGKVMLLLSSYKLPEDAAILRYFNKLSDRLTT